MNIKELTPRSLGCFQQVADVIGEYVAEVELQKVIDSEKTVWDFPDEDLLASFAWSTTPQGGLFWNSIDNGQIPEGYVPPTPVKSEENYEQPHTRSDEPKFGDVLHINDEPFVFIKSSSDRYYTTVNQEGVVRECDKEVFDEYAPNPHQEQRERILKRWQRKTLDNSFDTEVCIAEMRVSDLIDFVQENILAET